MHFIGCTKHRLQYESCNLCILFCPKLLPLFIHQWIFLTWELICWGLVTIGPTEWLNWPSSHPGAEYHCCKNKLSLPTTFGLQWELSPIFPVFLSYPTYEFIFILIEDWSDCNLFKLTLYSPQQNNQHLSNIHWSKLIHI